MVFLISDQLIFFGITGSINEIKSQTEMNKMNKT